MSFKEVINSQTVLFFNDKTVIKTCGVKFLISHISCSLSNLHFSYFFLCVVSTEAILALKNKIPHKKPLQFLFSNFLGAASQVHELLSPHGATGSTK